jgi:hypothetical protein
MAGAAAEDSAEMLEKPEHLKLFRNPEFLNPYQFGICK